MPFSLCSLNFNHTDPISADVSVPAPDPVTSIDKTVPAGPTAPVAPSSAIQSVLDEATQAWKTAYKQVVQDSIKALSVTK